MHVSCQGVTLRKCRIYRWMTAAGPCFKLTKMPKIELKGIGVSHPFPHDSDSLPIAHKAFRNSQMYLASTSRKWVPAPYSGRRAHTRAHNRRCTRPEISYRRPFSQGEVVCDLIDRGGKMGDWP